MKTAIRIIEQQFNSHSHYRHLYIQVLGKQYSHSDSLTVVGTISFQSDKAKQARVDAGEETNLWYGATFEVTSDKPEAFFTMGKLARQIKNNSSYDLQPSETVALINGEEYVYNNADYIPAAYVGKMTFFKVFRDGDTYYTNIYAANGIIAEKQLAKLTKNKQGTFTLLSQGLVQAS